MSRIVKGSVDGALPDRNPGSGRLIKHQVADAQEDADRIRREAEGAARDILEKARASAERLEAEARERGYEAGCQQWTEQALELTRARRRLIEDSREDLLKLSIKLAQKILGHELQTRPEALGELVLKAIRGLPQQGKVQVRVRPQDLEVLRAQKARLVAEIGQGVEIDLREDPTIEEGGCVIETPMGIIDARLETQMRVLERALLHGTR